jgi:glycosyltransferase involved in cell wall biosynthesis
MNLMGYVGSMEECGVTIAIACFNHGHFLAKAIESAQNQNHPASEIIVVDDGSTDNTEAVARTFDHVRYCWQPNRGLSAARNAALDVACSRYILFLDADDVLRPCALQEGLKALAAHPHAAFVYGGYEEVAEAGHKRKVDAQEKIDPFNSLLRWNFIGMHGTVIYNSKLLRDIGGFDTTLMVCEDWDVYLRLARLHDIQPYFCVAAEYRRVEGSLSNQYPLRMLDFARTVLSRQKDLNTEQEDALAEGLRGITRCYSAMAAWTLISNVRRREFREAISLAREAIRRDTFFFSRVLRAAVKLLGDINFR